MIRNLLAPLAAATLALTLPAAASAQAQAQAATAPTTAELETRFDPPLANPLRYRLIHEKSRNGNVESSTLEQEVTYSRSNDGVVMSLRPLRITAGFGSIDLTDTKAPIPPTLKPLMAPISFDLDSDGGIVRVRAWEEFKRNLVVSIPAIAAEAEPDPAKRPQAEKFMGEFFGKYTAASAEQAPQLVMKGWPDVLALMGTSATAGERVETTSVASIPLFPKPLNFKISLQMTAPPGSGALHIELISAPDPTELRTAIAGLIESMLKSAPAGPGKGRLDLEREFADLNLTSTLVVDLDARTGLVRRAVMEKHTTVGSTSRLDRITIEAQ